MRTQSLLMSPLLCVLTLLIFSAPASAQGQLSVSPTSITVQAVVGAPVPSQIVDISSSGNGALKWAISTPTASWLSVSPTSGTQAAKVTVSVASTLAAGTSSASFTVSTNQSAVTVNVQVTINSPTSPPTSVSPDGAMVPTTTSQIVDNTGAVWTIASNGAILRNGTSAAGGYGSKIYWKNNTIYVYGSDSNWWQWTGSGWSNIGPTQPGTTSSSTSVSPDGAMVPTTTSQIVDNTGAV